MLKTVFAWIGAILLIALLGGVGFLIYGFDCMDMGVSGHHLWEKH